MKWISIKDELPIAYDWVVAGHIGHADEDSMCWNIARYVDGVWEFINSNNSEIKGAYCGDVWCIVDLDRITHWISIPWGLDD